MGFKKSAVNLWQVKESLLKLPITHLESALSRQVTNSLRVRSALTRTAERGG